MRTIGLVGGISWLSTVDYYRYINEDVTRRLGGMNNARIVLNSLNVEDGFAMMRRGDMAGVGDMLVDAARVLHRAGADLIGLCANTAHVFADKVATAVPLPLVHLADAVAGHVAASGVRRLGVMATRTTIATRLYHDRLAARGIACVVPGDAAQTALDGAIEAGVAACMFGPDERTVGRGIAGDLCAAGADSLLLGCTEVPLMVGDAPFAVPAFDSTRIHAAALVAAAMAP